jgi:hypothetical protein
MALTEFQRIVCRLIAKNRIESGESYLAGAAALNELLRAPRISRDVDLFHDTETALETAWLADRRLLQENGFSVQVIRERPSFIEADVARESETVLLQWVRDSAYRFFPLVEHAELGLTLHPFDLATNKVLALVGRPEVRDWVDLIECDREVQPLGYLAWAACGKDPGLGPAFIIEHAARSRYSTEEVSALSFAGSPPDAAELSRRWKTIVNAARETIAQLPAHESGKCMLTRSGQLFTGTAQALGHALARGDIVFHAGAIRGVLPRPLDY